MGHTLQKLEMLNKYHGVIRCWFVLECPLRALGASICDRLCQTDRMGWKERKNKVEVKVGIKSWHRLDAFYSSNLIICYGETVMILRSR
jgi:hypothetical protein